MLGRGLLTAHPDTGRRPRGVPRLFRDHARLVHRHAVRVTGDWAVAEDIISLTFLEAWRLRARLRDEGDSARPG